MPRTARAVVVLLLAAAATAQDAPPTFRSEAQVVVLDLVATDRRGRPVDDLRADELQVSEDGRACEMRSFRLVRAAPGPVVPATKAAAPPAEPAASGRPTATPIRPSLVVLVFDRLTTATAPLARKGALDLLAGDIPADTWLAVFKIGYGVRALASLTTDRGALERAVETATLGDVDKAGPVATAAPLAAPPAPIPQGGPAGPAAVVLPGLREVAAGLAAVESGQLLAAQSLDSLYALLGVARALGVVEGRKTIVYFAEGWHLPIDSQPQLQQAYDDAVSAANRANVAVHTVDARGLTAHKPMGLTPIDSVLDAFTADNALGPGEGAYTPALKAGGTGDGGGATGGFTPRRLAGSERDRLAGPNLERLADDTGGLAIASTNDLGSGLARVAQELRQYYEVVYAPANPVQDGRFRRIGVKVLRPGVRVRTRAGYFATPGRATTVAAYELPLMGALGASVPARDFTLRADVLHFAPRNGERECVVLAEVPLSEVQIAADGAAGLFRAHLSLLGYVKDEGGRVVARLTHDWPIEGPLAERERARAQSALFRQSLLLPPGRYRLEAAVHDQLGGGKAVARSAFEVPPADAGLGLGSPVVVKRASASPGGAPTQDPLRLGDLSLVPGLGAPFEAGSTPELPVFVSVYPAQAAGPVALNVELQKEGRVVAQAAPDLPAADTNGRVTWAGGIPAGRLLPGAYELVVRATQGDVAAEERAALEVTPGRIAPPAPAIAEAKVDPVLVPVLEQAGRYVVDYQDSFRNIVAEEAYTQTAVLPGSGVTQIGAGGQILTRDNYQKRTTRADLVFVRLAGDIPWGLFRDVFEVNGQKVRDRDERLTRLFQQPSPSALEQAQRILEESARYNIGGAVRTVNLPTLPLVFLHPRNQHRFSFRAGERRRIAGFQGLEVRFEETARPTLVKDASGGDLPARGRFWIDPSRGAVLRSEVVFRFEPHRAEGSIETEYRPQPHLGIWVPFEMKETYEDLLGTSRPLFHAPTRARARYSNLRQFTVTYEDESAALPSAPPPEPR